MTSAAVIFDLAYYYKVAQPIAERIDGRVRLSYVMKTLELDGVHIMNDYRYGFTATKNGNDDPFTEAIRLPTNGSIQVEICGRLKRSVTGGYQQPHSVDIAISRCIEESYNKIKQRRIDKVIVIAGDRDFEKEIRRGSGDVRVLATARINNRLEPYRLKNARGEVLYLDKVIEQASRMQLEEEGQLLPHQARAQMEGVEPLPVLQQARSPPRSAGPGAAPVLRRTPSVSQQPRPIPVPPPRSGGAAPPLRARPVDDEDVIVYGGVQTRHVGNPTDRQRAASLSPGGVARAALIADASHLTIVRERTRTSLQAPPRAPLKMERVVARMENLLGVKLVELVWVDKRGVHDEQFLRFVEGAGFEMRYKEDNTQVNQTIGAEVMDIKDDYDAIFVVTASPSVPHEEWRSMGKVKVINAIPCSPLLHDLRVLDLVEDIMKPVLQAEMQQAQPPQGAAAAPVTPRCRFGTRCRNQGTCPLEHVAVGLLPCPFYHYGGCKDSKCKYLPPHNA